MNKWAISQDVIEDDLQQMKKWMIENKHDTIKAISETDKAAEFPADFDLWEKIAFPAFLVGARFALQTFQFTMKEGE